MTLRACTWALLCPFEPLTSQLADHPLQVPQFDLSQFCSESAQEASIRIAAAEPPTVGSAMFDPGRCLHLSGPNPFEL